MLGAAPGVPALGRGPGEDGRVSRSDYHHPAAGWGATRSVGRVLLRAREPVAGTRALLKMNHEDGGFDWIKCNWPPMEIDDHYGATLAAIGAWLSRCTNSTAGSSGMRGSLRAARCAAYASSPSARRSNSARRCMTAS